MRPCQRSFRSAMRMPNPVHLLSSSGCYLHSTSVRQRRCHAAPPVPWRREPLEHRLEVQQRAGQLRLLVLKTFGCTSYQISVPVLHELRGSRLRALHGERRGWHISHICPPEGLASEGRDDLVALHADEFRAQHLKPPWRLARFRRLRREKPTLSRANIIGIRDARTQSDWRDASPGRISMERGP
jgi:hypothetical protein